MIIDKNLDIDVPTLGGYLKEKNAGKQDTRVQNHVVKYNVGREEFTMTIRCSLRSLKEHIENLGLILDKNSPYASNQAECSFKKMKP